MKLYFFVIVSTLLLMQTVSALPGLGLRYFRSSVDNVNKYRIRDTIPNSEGLNDAPPTADVDKVDAVPKVTDRVRVDAPQESMRPEKPIRGNTQTSEGMPITQFGDDEDFNDAPMYTSDAQPNNNFKTADTDAAPQRRPLPRRRGNGFAVTDPQSVTDSDQVPSPQNNKVSPSALGRLRQFAGLTTVLANIARIPQAVALQIDSVMAGLQNTYPTNTNVGAYMMGTRFMLRNQGALRVFDFMDRAGIGRLDELVSSMPSIFNPIFNYLERLMYAIGRRGAAAFQRFGDAARRVTERARSSLSGINVARNNDSYSVSIPDLIDMVLKGRLANAVDEVVGRAQSRIQAGLSSVGSMFSSNMPTPMPTEEEGPARNQPYQMGNSRFSTMRDYYRPARYFQN